MSKVLELKEKRQNLVLEARSILEGAKTQKRDMSAEEETRYSAIDTEIDTLTEDIQSEERNSQRESKLSNLENSFEKRAGSDFRPGADQGSTDGKEAREAFKKFIRSGRSALSEAEVRALSSGSDVDGGFLNTPQNFVQQLLKAVDDVAFIRGMATTFQLGKAESMGVPTMTADVSDADWTAELATGNADTALKFGKRELKPHPLAKRILVSKKLINSSVMDIEKFVRDRLAYKFGITQEKAHLLGSGSQQPLGLFVASTDGITTARDVSTGNTATSIAFDGLIEAKFSLKGQYLPKAKWLFHRNGVKQIRKLKDGDGQYLWQPSVVAGEPDAILSVPYVMSEYAPSTFTTGQYVGIIGDFSYYWIVDSLAMELQRLVELYAETNQVGFIGRLETDGMPVLAEAFARVKLG